MEWTEVITIIVSIVIANVGIFAFVNFNLNKRIDDFGGSLNKRFDDLGGKLDKRLDDFKELFKSELSSIRSEMKADKELFQSEMGSMRSEFKAELKLVHETLNNHINSEIKANRDEIKALDQKMDNGFNELKELIKRSKA